MKRLFIAIPIYEKSRAEIVKNILSDESVKKMPVRWTSLQNMHLTLQFLGDVEEKRIPELKQILSGIKSPQNKETLRFTSIGAFPNPSAARVIWIGMKRNEYLLKMQKDLVSSLDHADFSVDRKSFKPHLTLGRVRESGRILPESFAHLESLAAASPVSDSPLERVILFESLLRPGGPIYTPVFEKVLV